MKISLLATLSTLSLILIISCGGSSTGPKDDTPPEIQVVLPADNTVDIAVDNSICAVFSESVDSLTVDNSSFAVTPSLSGTFEFRGDTVRFVPSSDMSYGTEYTVTLSPSITDTAGNKISAQFQWSFTTIEDPDSAPPVVVETSPSGGAYDVETNTAVTATFSKGIDPSTLTSSSFTVSGGVTGTITYSNKTATFTPDSDLDYSASYIVTVTTAVADTFGINLAQDFLWSFTTRPDPSIPIVRIVSPVDNAIVDETVNFTVYASQQDGIDKVELYVGGNAVDSVLGQSGNVTFTRDVSMWNIGSVHNIFAKAYAGGYENTSRSISLIYLWEEVATDINDPWSTDIKRIYKRTTSDLLELRYEFWENWTYPYIYDSINDTTYYDLSLDLAIFFDTDRNKLSGRTEIGDGTLNDIGAEYRVILGFHGGDDSAFARPSLTTTDWIPIYDTTGFARHVVPRDTNVLELAIPWSDLDTTGGVNILSINVNLKGGESDYKFDWTPDKGMGHIFISRANQYIGKINTLPKVIVRSTPSSGRGLPEHLDNPFD